MTRRVDRKVYLGTACGCRLAWLARENGERCVSRDQLPKEAPQVGVYMLALSKQARTLGFCNHCGIGHSRPLWPLSVRAAAKLLN